jgi:hypothetical protein
MDASCSYVEDALPIRPPLLQLCALLMGLIFNLMIALLHLPVRNLALSAPEDVDNIEPWKFLLSGSVRGLSRNLELNNIYILVIAPTASSHFVRRSTTSDTMAACRRMMVAVIIVAVQSSNLSPSDEATLCILVALKSNLNHARLVGVQSRCCS